MSEIEVEVEAPKRGRPRKYLTEEDRKTHNRDYMRDYMREYMRRKKNKTVKGHSFTINDTTYELETEDDYIALIRKILYENSIEYTFK